MITPYDAEYDPEAEELTVAEEDVLWANVGEIDLQISMGNRAYLDMKAKQAQEAFDMEVTA